MRRNIIIAFFAISVLSCQKGNYTYSDDVYGDSDTKTAYKTSGNDPYFHGTPVTAYIMGEADLLESSTEKSRILAKLNAGEEITIIGKGTGGYYKVKRGDYIGYVFQNYVISSTPLSSGSNPAGGTHDMSTKTIQTGPRGGKYYKNKNGNKVTKKRN